MTFYVINARKELLNNKFNNTTLYKNPRKKYRL